MSLYGRATPPSKAPALAPWLRALLLEGVVPEAGAERLAYVRARFVGQGRPLREAWRQHGPALTAEWVKERPGSRPWGWWEFEDVLGDVDAREGESQADYEARLDELDRESDAAFLKRRGLLLPGELERIPPAAFKPKPAASGAPRGRVH